MRFLVLDTADARGSVAVFEDTQLLYTETHPEDQDYSSWLLPAVHRVMDDSSLTLDKLDAYAVCAGPGLFTGLRVGLTTVKAWAEVYRKPIAALSRLEALTLGSLHQQEQFIAACFDARRGQLFAALYARGVGAFEPVGEEAVIALPDFVTRIANFTSGKPVRWITPDVSLLECSPAWPSLVAAGHVLQDAPPPFAPRLGLLAHLKFQQGQTTDALALDANYVRRSDAEIFWKGNNLALKAQSTAGRSARNR